MNRRDFLKSVGLAAIALPRFGFAASDAMMVLIEAEGFKKRGGWVLDQQFMDQMGSPYLLAVGQNGHAGRFNDKFVGAAVRRRKLGVRLGMEQTPDYAAGPDVQRRANARRRPAAGRVAPRRRHGRDGSDPRAAARGYTCPPESGPASSGCRGTP